MRLSPTLMVFSGVGLGVMLAWACGPAATGVPETQAQVYGQVGALAAPNAPVDPLTARLTASDGPAESAPASPAPGPCKQWEVMHSLVLPSYAEGKAVLPEGWEPFAATPTSFSVNASVFSRRCIK